MAVDAPHARVVGVAEIREARRALAQRELERGHREQLRPHPENLQQVARRGVDRHDAVAETVGEERRFGLIGGRGHGCHKRTSDGQGCQCNRRTTNARTRKTPATRTASVQFTRYGQQIGRRVRVYNRVARFAFL